MNAILYLFNTYILPYNYQEYIDNLIDQIFEIAFFLNLYQLNFKLIYSGVQM